VGVTGLRILTNTASPTLAFLTHSCLAACLAVPGCHLADSLTDPWPPLTPGRRHGRVTGLRILSDDGVGLQSSGGGEGEAVAGSQAGAGK
jgi:hypothetical protein